MLCGWEKLTGSNQSHLRKETLLAKQAKPGLEGEKAIEAIADRSGKQNGSLSFRQPYLQPHSSKEGLDLNNIACQ